MTTYVFHCENCDDECEVTLYLPRSETLIRSSCCHADVRAGEVFELKKRDTPVNAALITLGRVMAISQLALQRSDDEKMRTDMRFVYQLTREVLDHAEVHGKKDR